ncbi:MAG: hypothetical protein ACSHYB_18850 [Roseibacillus sp.]
MIRRFFNKAIWLFVHKIPWKPILIWGPWIVLLVIVFFYSFENWRGNRAVGTARLKAADAGLSLEIKDHLPLRDPKIPNPSDLPGFDGRKTPSIKRMIYDKRLGFDTTPKGKEATRSTGRWKAERRDIRKWLDPSLAVATFEEAAIELDRLAPEFDILRELVAQKGAHPLIFNPKSSNPTFQDISAVSYMPALTLTEALRDDTTIALSVGDQQRAFENLSLMLDILNFESYPNLVSFLIRCTIAISCEEAIWEAAASSPLLSDEQLTLLAMKLDKLAWEDELQAALDGELSYILAYCEESKMDKEFLIEALSWSNLRLFSHLETGWYPFDDAMLVIDETLFRMMPSGWIDQAEANFILRSLSLRNESAKSPKVNLHFPARLYTDEAMSLFREVREKSKTAVARTRLARIGVELERVKQKEGQYPDSLDQFSHINTKDPFSNKPVHYRLKHDRTPLLWSVGLNKIDEDGLPGRKRNEGDIVWMLSPTPDLTKADLRKKLHKHRLSP